MGKILHSKSPYGISIKYWHTFKGFHINLDKYSAIIENYHGENYKGFLGKLYQVTFSNEKGKHIISMNYHGNDVIMLVYKKDGRFFLIMIYSPKGLPVTKDMLDNLKLN